MNLTQRSGRWVKDSALNDVYGAGAARAAPFGLLLILNPGLRWVPLESDSSNQGDRSDTMNTSGAGLGRQTEQEKWGGGEGLRGVRLPAKQKAQRQGGGLPRPGVCPRCPPPPASALAGMADAPSL